MSGTEDRHQFYEWVHRIGEVAHRRFQTGDRSGLIRAIGRLENLADGYGCDPYLSILETTAANCVLNLAIMLLSDFDFETSLVLCEGVHGILTEKQQRYRLSGRTPRPDSSAWCTLVYVLAEAKWKGPEVHRNRVASPRLMVEWFLTAEERIRTGTLKYPNADPLVNRRRRKLTSWCCLELIKLCMRYEPGLVGPLHKVFHDIGNWSVDDRDLPFYWELEICRLWLDSCADRAAVDRCFAEYASTLETFKDEDDIFETGETATAAFKNAMLRRRSHHPDSLLEPVFVSNN